MYHVKLAVKALSVAPPGTAPPAMAPASRSGFESRCRGDKGGAGSCMLPWNYASICWRTCLPSSAPAIQLADIKAS